MLDDIPIIYAVDSNGEMQHVDNVANGLACGCFCPDPNCHQALIARNAGTKKIHHFAHQQGSCAWSLEYVVVNIVYEILKESKRFAFPELKLRNMYTRRTETITEGQSLPIENVRLENLSGRAVPEVVFDVENKTGVRSFAVVVCFTHELKHDERQKLKEDKIDSIELDLRDCLQKRKKSEGKHYDRMQTYLDFQTPNYLKGFSFGKDDYFRKWIYNTKLIEAAQKNKEVYEKRQQEEARKRAEEQKRLAAEKEKREAERRRLEELEEEERQKWIEKQKRKQEEAKIKAAEEAKRAEAEEESYFAIEAKRRREWFEKNPITNHDINRRATLEELRLFSDNERIIRTKAARENHEPTWQGFSHFEQMMRSKTKYNAELNFLNDKY